MSRGTEEQGSLGAEGQRSRGNSELRALVGCAGFGGVEIALREFGVETTGIEIDNAIAEVNRYNGGHCLTADLLDVDVDPADYVGWWLYHFSPPCPRFSLARNSKAVQSLRDQVLDLARHQRVINGETEQDIRLARKICEFIRVGRPEYFTLENVWGYRKSLSWHLIQYTLLEEGYGIDAWHLNAADYGVPQSRKRMIVIARRDGRQPAKPWPTHAKRPDMFTKPWWGWYSAIEDLIPSLPESQFAPWQMDRLPDELKTFLMMIGNTNRNGFDNKPGRGCLTQNEPANTVTSKLGGAMPKAFLIPVQKHSTSLGVDSPAPTITAAHKSQEHRALLVPGDNTSNNTVRESDEPMVTIQSRTPGRCPHRAFILGQGSRSELKEGDEPTDTVTANGNQSGVKAVIIDSANSSSGSIRSGDELFFTVTTNAKTAPSKAFVVGGRYQTPSNGKSRTVQNRGADCPIWTICAIEHMDTRALVNGYVVSMTPRALARFQDFPDWFVLPGEAGLDDNLVLLLHWRSDRELACYGVGNALPPGMYRAVLRSLI